MTDDLIIYTGDCRKVMLGMAPKSIDCIVTSPPYWAKRDYQMKRQFGLEKTLKAYVAGMVDVFRIAREVLKDDGTVWLNIGDSYAQDGGPGWQGMNGNRADRRYTLVRDTVPMREATRRPPPGLKAKDLMLIPARIALALQADGWWVRSEIIWAKPTPMPESVTDRPTSSHEMIYLLSKSETYYYDAEAIKEPARSDHSSGNGFKRTGRLSYQNEDGTSRGSGKQWEQVGGTRNKRDVWTVQSVPYAGNHHATYPPELVLPCILAGSRPGGTVLDPFLGSGTTAMVAIENGRKAVGIELNPEYVQLARERCDVTRPLPGFKI